MQHIVSFENVFSNTYWKIPFTVRTDAYDKYLGAVISQNNKPIELFSNRLRNSQYNYTTTEKEIIVILECLKQSPGIIFGYEINVFSYNKNVVYAATLSEYQRVMR